MKFGRLLRLTPGREVHFLTPGCFDSFTCFSSCMVVHVDSFRCFTRCIVLMIDFVEGREAEVDVVVMEGGLSWRRREREEC